MNAEHHQYCVNRSLSSNMTKLPFEAPLPWLWSCHHCHARYPLGATRRCLHDGHYFCGGTTVSALTGKPIKRHKACGSDFDYVGWEDVSRWQRKVYDSKLDIAERLKRQISCEHSCAYPSACHHRTKKSSTRKRSGVGKESLSTASRTSVNEFVTANKSDLQSFLDPNCLEVEPVARPLETAEKTTLAAFPAPKSSESMLKRMINSARRNSRYATSVPTTEETVLKNALRPTRSASPMPLASSPSTFFTTSEPVGARASAKELGLAIPALEIATDLPSFFSPESSSSSSDETFSEESFSETPSLEAHSDEDLDKQEEQTSKKSNARSLNTTRRTSQALHIDLGLDDMSNLPDIDMTDSIPNSPTSPTLPSMFTFSDGANLGGLLTPKSPDSPTNPLFRVRDGLKHDNEQATPPSPLSPRRGAWGWMGNSTKDPLEDVEMSDTTPLADVDIGMEATSDLGLGLGQ